MTSSLQLIGAPDEPDLLFLPWDTPLEEWPEDLVVALPQGISRHLVRFVRLNDRIYAVKEVQQEPAQREYERLFDLHRLAAPAVEPIGVVLGRSTSEGEPLPAALVTRHLQFSLPYRSLFSQTLREDTAAKLQRALAVLLVRLHLLGFSWNDCSLSNTLFRRDAGAFAAYLVDAETGEIHPRLSDGQRENDIDIAVTNVIGELMDLQVGGLLDPSLDPLAYGESLRSQYENLWREVTGTVTFGPGERYLFDAQIRRLNDLGFDVAELHILPAADGTAMRVSPKVVDAGHHGRRLMRLTGIDSEEEQARRLLNDLDSWHARYYPHDDDEIVAHRWVTERFEMVTGAVPRDLRRKLEAPQIFHEVLEHRWFMSERAGHDVGLTPAIEDYVATVLIAKPDEAALIAPHQAEETE